ncbi:MAG: 16S rRNA (guanine(527)-N(7))-methyltransferase RsmG [Clostridia bacterium]|nr:16S rRNA (guanine(527)-N(7))-methyltransferase RsmG [Clostridia bacterium]
MERTKKFIEEKSKEIGIDLSKTEINLFYSYMQNLLEWNKKVNLTAITDEKDIIIKHFIDSIIINKEIEGNTMLDIGSGAGFPGIPLKIINNKMNVVLLDAINKKVTFMNDTINKLDLKNIIAIHGRAEDYAHDDNYREKFDIVISRAVSNMTTLVEYMLPFVSVGGKCLCLKGPSVQEELDSARNAIKILGGKIDKVCEYTVENNERTLIIISKEKNTEQIYPRKQGKPLKEPLR